MHRERLAEEAEDAQSMNPSSASSASQLGSSLESSLLIGEEGAAPPPIVLTGKSEDGRSRKEVRLGDSSRGDVVAEAAELC